ncbi:methionine aminopeptidase [Pseudocitrobacter sp. RIT415]|nr:methionine aminopeptidase [Pseudocitrobacter sp. RIT 415]
MHGINELSHVGLRLFYFDGKYTKPKCSLFRSLIPARR